MFEEPDEPQDKTDVTREVHQDFARLRKSSGKFFKRLISLNPGLDRPGTVKRIQENKQMLGANAWLLMCSIMVASLGLDLNSPAVIIGAMLISPLMSPILGIGFGIATNDRETLSTSGRHFGVAIAIALLTSTLYFFFTPFGNITNEILSRTEPTALDVAVALFGGIAGIVSMSRKDQSNAIPGVAIATALMPPLCVTGFGLAKALEKFFGPATISMIDPWPFIANSFYLFFLNSFFVALATFVMVRFIMQFPLKKYADRKARRNTIILISFFSLIMILPSIFIMRKVVHKVNLQRGKDNFIHNYLGDKLKYLDNSRIISSGDQSTLILKVYGSAISIKDSAMYLEGMKASGLTNTSLEIIPTSEIDLSAFHNLQSEIEEVSDALEEEREPPPPDDPIMDDFNLLMGDLPVYSDAIVEAQFAPSMVRADSVFTPVVLIKWREDLLIEEKEKAKATVRELFARRNINQIEIANYTSE